MDYHSMKRKELQSLCKKHNIRANLTNLAMADALSALNLVDGVQIFLPESPVNSGNKPQSDLIDNEPIPVRLARSRRAPLLELSVASEEETIVTLPKTSAPRICQKKTAAKIVSNAKENNNEKEKEVPDVNHITTRATRLQQKSELKLSGSVLKVGGKMIMKFIGYFLEQEVDGVEETVPETTVTSRKSLSARKPQSDLVDNEPRIPVRLARSRRAPLLESSSASEEIIPKTSAPRTSQKKTEGKVVSKAKRNNKEKEMEIPVVNHITRRSTRFQQNSKLKISESVQKVEANKTDMLSEEVNVEEMKSESQVTDDVSQKNDGTNGNSSKEEQDDVASGNVDGVEKTVPESPATLRKSLSARKPQSNLVDNEPSIPVGLARSRRAHLLEKSAASMEEIIPKTSAPSTCQKKTEGKVVSKAKGNNNEKEVFVVDHITRQSTRLQQKSKLKMSDSVLKVGETNEAKKTDMLSEEVNNEEMKSESEVTDDVLQKNGGITGMSSKEEQDDLVPGNVNSIMLTTESSMLQKSGDSNATSEDPSSALIMGELSKASTTHAFGECISENRSAFAEESSLNIADVPNESSLVEGNTEITQVHTESENQLMGKNEVIEDKGALDLEVKVDNEPAYVMVTEAEALLGDESFPIVEKMEKPEDYDAEEGKHELKCKTGLYDFQLTEVEALSLDAQSMECEDQLIEVEVIEDTGTNERTFVILSEVEALSVESSPIFGITENFEDGSCYLDAQSMACADQMIEIEVIEDKGANERTYVLLSEVEAPSVDESSPKVGNTENFEDLDVYKVANKLEYVTKIYIFNVSELEELSSDSDCFYFEAMKDMMEELMNIQEAEDCTFKIQQDCDKSRCINVAADFETSYDEEDDSFVEFAISDIEVIGDKGANEHTYVLLSEVEALSVDESSPKVGNTENFENSDVYEVANKLEYKTEIYVFNVSELEELSSDSDCFYFEAMKDLMEESMNTQEAKNCAFKIQQDCDKSQCINVAADFETSFNEEYDSDVELAISNVVEENEKDNSDDTIDENGEWSDVDETSNVVATDQIVNQTSPKFGNTENFEDSDAYEVANTLEYETEIYVFNVAELEELSSDSDCFYFEAMKDLMEESMNVQEAENCTFKIQQDCNESLCINVAADFETSYVEEDDLYVELAISDVVEENKKGNSGDTIDENEDWSGMDETSNVVATDQIVNQTPVPLATPERKNKSGNQVQQISRLSSTKKKAATSSGSFIKVLDDNKEIDEIGKFSIRSTSKVATKVVAEEKENKHESTAQRKLKTKSLGQLRKMMKHLNVADTNNTIVKEQLHLEKRPALQQLSNNNLVHEKEN
ncbi:hypothetical protein MKX01_029638 [Papaver californicum]|nr:hypothetical protein MKX01_029638 [Papaver californicum]